MKLQTYFVRPLALITPALLVLLGGCGDPCLDDGPAKGDCKNPVGSDDNPTTDTTADGTADADATADATETATSDATTGSPRMIAANVAIVSARSAPIFPSNNPSSVAPSFTAPSAVRPS